jgi:hypothetical protein
MFKKGDYIVLLKSEENRYDNDEAFPVNYCYKQRENSLFIEPELDLKGSKTNGWVIHPFNKSKDNDWRYATPKEKAHYDLIGKPFNVNSLVLPEGYPNWGWNWDIDSIRINPSDFSSLFATGFADTCNAKSKEEKTMKEKKIIGYKLKEQYEKYEKIVLKLLNISENRNLHTINDDKYDFSNGSIMHKEIKQAGVLDLWFDPVYEEKKELPKINGYEGNYSKINGTIEYGCVQFKIENLVDLWECVKGFKEDKDDTFTPHNRTIYSFKLNSGVEITIEQLNQIVEYIDSKK